MKRFVLAAIAVCLVLVSNALAILSGGGTQANPYLIQSRAEFDEFANVANAGVYWASGVITKLTCDVNLAGTTYTQAVIAADTSTASGFQGTPFTGKFDGNGYKISNLTITASTKNSVGLFGYVGSGGQIENLGVVNATITGGTYVGGLVGLSDSGTMISCYATGSVTGIEHVGGLVGENTGTLTFCYSTGSVSGDSKVGGMVGRNYSGTITACYATGSVSGTGNDVGGLVARNDLGTITSSYATGSVSGGRYYVGGLVGINLGTLTSCYATGSVAGSSYSYVGGLVGGNTGTVTSCYSTGNVNATGSSSYVGGLVGENCGTVTSCYSTGAVSGIGSCIGGLVGYNYSSTVMGYNYPGTVTSCYSTGSVSGTGSYVGGLVGYHSSGTITACFWDINASSTMIGVGYGLLNGVAGKTTAEMMAQSTFTDAGWDFVEIWTMPWLGQQYPRLAWQTVIPGDIAGLYGVNLEDYSVVAAAWQAVPSDANWNPAADLNSNGAVDFLDMLILSENWLAGI